MTQTHVRQIARARRSTEAPAPTRQRAEAASPAAAIGNQLMQALQPKLEVNAPGDAYEREADRIAGQVTTMPDVAAQRTVGPDERVGERIQARPLAAQVTPLAQRAAAPPKKDDDKKAQRAAAPPKKDDDKKAQRAAAPPKKDDDKKAQRAAAPPKKDDDKKIQKRGGPGEASPEVAADIERQQRGGRPLDPQTRAYFEARFGADFSGVRIHDDAEAARAAQSLNAQAFTQGGHIFFDAGCYQPGDAPGRQLLAHELTHTIQQGATTPATPQAQAALPKAPAQRVIQRAEGEGGGGNGGGSVPTGESVVDVSTTPPRIKLGQLPLPPFKAADHRGQLYLAHPLFKAASYSREEPEQAERWDSSIHTDGTQTALTNAPYQLEPNGVYYMRLKPELGSGLRPQDRQAMNRIGSAATIAPGLLRPVWDSQGNYESFHVDHIVELQVSGWPRARWANTDMNNLELLNAHANTSSGSQIKNAITSALAAFIESPQREQLPERDKRRTNASLRSYISSNYDLVFEGISPTLDDPPRGVKTWCQKKITDGEHMAALALKPKAQRVFELYDLNNPDPTQPDSAFMRHPNEPEFRQELRIIQGSEERFVVYWQSFGGQRSFFQWGSSVGRTGTETTDIQERDHRAIPGMYVLGIVFNPGGTGEELGRLDVMPFKYGSGWGRNIRGVQKSVRVKRIPGLRYAGYLDPTDYRAFEISLDGLSPIEFDGVHLDDREGLVMTGRIIPTVPLISRAPIDIILTADDLRAQRTFQAGDFALPGPFHVTSSDLTLAIGLASGLSISGRMDMSVDRLGTGFLEGRASTGQGFSLAGGFDFDSKLFEPAHIGMRYENGEFSAQGNIGIPNGKVRGIRSALLNMTYAQNTFTADGTIEPNVPGVRQGRLNVVYSEQAGLVISGALELAPNPAIRSGHLEARVERKPDGAYKVAASGTAEPAIPGVNSQIVVRYDDGAFDAEVTAAFSRGMLNGDLRIAATNRPVDPATGQPGGEPTNQITVYGGGQVTVRFSPWLQGTVGLRLLPNGEIEISGEVALPSAVDIFESRRFDRNIFRLNIDIPIVGVSVAGQNIGIFATIGGGLDLTAGIGPGQIRDLRLGVTYNPSHEEDTHVTGHGELAIPADAGLRLSIRGGIGAGIPIVSARAGIEVGGELGLAGTARAAVDVDWTPRRGLVLDAVGEVFVEPRLKLDVNAFAEVTANILVDTIELYKQRWQLAKYEYGSNLRFGVRFPVHYEEGRPFAISMDNLEFTLPDIDARSILTSVLS